MHRLLHSLADIRSGHTFRDRIAHDPQGDVRILQIKDIKGRSEVQPDALLRVQWEGSGTPPLLKSGDIVLPARGDHYDAALANGKDKIIPTSQLFVVHANTNSITPEFLCWYLNQAAARKYFHANRLGTSIPMLNRQVLGLLPVLVPPVEMQHKIVALQRLLDLERQITEQLLHNREIMLTGIFQRLLES